MNSRSIQVRPQTEIRSARMGQWILLCFVLLATFGCAVNSVSTSAETPAAESAPIDGAATVETPDSVDEGAAEDSAQSSSESASEMDEELEWVFDEERQWHYTIVQVDRVERGYYWVDESTIRARGGVSFEVIDHDEEYLWLKVWKPNPGGRGAQPAQEAPPVVADLPAVSWDSVDRVSLESWDQGLPRSGQWRNNFTMADMNGDGHLDIVFGPARKSRSGPNIFLGDGAGAWASWRGLRFAGRPLDYGGVAVGDFNADGRPDIAFGIHLRGMMAFVQGDNGEFLPWDDGIAWDEPGAGGEAFSFSSRRVDVLDWDGDGDDDILALGEGPKGVSGRRSRNNIPNRLIDTSRGMVLYENLGEGTWEGRRLDGGVHFGDQFSLADLNGDGLRDLVLASRRGGATDILQIGQEDGQMVEEQLAGLRLGAFVSSVAAGDLDGDGRVDVALGHRTKKGDKWYSGIDLHYGDKKGAWERVELALVEGRSDYTAIEFGDVDGDGREDVVALTGDGRLEVFLGARNRRFFSEVTPESPALAAGCSGSMVHVEDLNGDGRADIVAAFSGEAVGVTGVQGLSQPGCPGEGSLRAWVSGDGGR